MNASTGSTLPPKISLTTRMVAGAGIGLAVILFFILPVHDPRPEWGKLWMLRPLIIVPMAGATGGAFSYLFLQFGRQLGVNKIVIVILSTVVFVVGLWMGIVLGLDGTLWD